MTIKIIVNVEACKQRNWAEENDRVRGRRIAAGLVYGFSVGPLLEFILLHEAIHARDLFDAILERFQTDGLLSECPLDTNSLKDWEIGLHSAALAVFRAMFDLTAAQGLQEKDGIEEKTREKCWWEWDRRH